MNFETYFKPYIKQVNKTLDGLLPKESRHPVLLHQAMRYSVLPGGKRFRPVLTLIACEACGGDAKQALYPAAAVELIHAYSLVHDDLPALDNDDLRRGKPSCHRKFGEALAIMAGDGLLTMAFQVLTRVPSPEQALRLASEISTEAGSYGMIGGQVADLSSNESNPDLAMLDFISIHKTGKLIKASAVCGAIAAGASKEECLHITRYGELIGMAFQTIDDLIDGDGYMKLMKPRELKQKSRDLVAQAIREIRPLGRKAEKMKKMAEFLVQRIPRGKYVSVDR